VTRRYTGPVLPEGLTRPFVEESLVKAASIGHALGDSLDPAKISKNLIGYSSACSCGWVSTPKSKRIKAFAAGFVHIGEVLADDRWPSSDVGGVGASPDRPERLGDEAKRSSPGGEGESSSLPGGSDRAAVAAV
jgi:hypothetical protein